ncbi:MAG: hypothetical protein H6579_11185 [Chitinophagales bacterium]|nr:hypothetical protein [Chitinophagales bacterium]
MKTVLNKLIFLSLSLSFFYALEAQNTSTNNKASEEGISLQFVMNGEAAADWEIEITCYCTTEGKGLTNAEGKVFIPASDIKSKNIDVFGSKGSEKFELVNLVVLDYNNFAKIDPNYLLEKLKQQELNDKKLQEDMDADYEDAFGF